MAYCNNCMAEVQGMLSLDKKLKCEYCGQRLDINPASPMVSI